MLGKDVKVLGVLFDGFQHMDFAGPLMAFTSCSNKSTGYKYYRTVNHLPNTRMFTLNTVATRRGPVKSSSGVETVAEYSFDDITRKYDILLVPGGIGTRDLVTDADFLVALKKLAIECTIVLTVCTGSALLAATGLLDGKRATSNKRAWTWVTSVNDKVTWIKTRRWIQDDKYWTTGGVTAGTDGAYALVSTLKGAKVASKGAYLMEYSREHDSTKWDKYKSKL